jgi:A/G-specific adenine glycosylase
MTPSRPKKKIAAARRLLNWYDVHRRHLPWRAQPGERQDPYKVWLSEVMLQQTTVAAVAPYYRAFLSRWPTVHDLAKASLDEVLGAWSGLGYYARARNLHRAANLVERDFAGVFPQRAHALTRLPGIGEYTGGAIAAIAFGEREAAMDANAERVIARYFAVAEPLPGARVQLRAFARGLVPVARPGDFAQALMDLGASVCTSRKPSCPSCPLKEGCVAFTRHLQETIPVKTPKRVRPLKRGAAYVVSDQSGAILLTRRPEKGLLAGMLQPPLGPWTDKFPARREALKRAPVSATWRKRPGAVRHDFTHFALEIEVYVATVRKTAVPQSHWVPRAHLSGAALPTVMRKIIARGLDQDVAGRDRHGDADAARR